MLAGGSVSGRLEEHIRKMAQKYRALILEVTIIDHGRPYGWEWQVSDRGDVIMTGFESSVKNPQAIEQIHGLGENRRCNLQGFEAAICSSLQSLRSRERPAASVDGLQ